MIPKHNWIRQSSCDFHQPDGHKIRIAFETAEVWDVRNYWKRALRPKREQESRELLNAIPDPEDELYEVDEGELSDPIPPLSRLKVLDDDWDDARFRTRCTLSAPTDFDPRHHHGLSHFVEQVNGRTSELSDFLSYQLIAAIRLTIFEFFPEARITPPPDDPDFEAYLDVHVEPALDWLCNCDPNDFPTEEFEE